MFLIRSVKKNDLEHLFALSQVMNFINLPPYEDMIKKKIERSLKTFENPDKNLAHNHYIFVIEDTEKKKVIGVSMIHSQHGTEDEPHFYLTVGRENKFSQTLNTGFIHGTLKLGYDTNGPTEIGGLVLDPSYRGNENKIGKQLSFVRFLYMGMNPDRFKETIHAELLPPFDADGNSPLWEAIGRRFLNMNYQDADVLSRTNKEFILNLFPKEIIYEQLLPIEARNSIGKVGPETLPVKNMLEKIGFKYISQVDPFDGGPHFQAKLSEISLVKNMINGFCDPKATFDPDNIQSFLITLPTQSKNEFRGLMIKASLVKNGKNIILAPYPGSLEHLKLTEKFNTFAIPI